MTARPLARSDGSRHVHVHSAGLLEDDIANARRRLSPTPPRVVEVEVLRDTDEAIEFAHRLVTRTLGHLDTAHAKAWQACEQGWASTMSDLLFRAGHSPADVHRLTGELTQAAKHLVDAAFAQATDDLRTRLRTDMSVHLIPRLKESQ